MKKLFALLISFLSLFLVVLSVPINPIGAHADTGPKPTFEIRITNLEESTYVVGYGVKHKDYFGPHTIFIPGDETFGNSNFGNNSDLTLLYNNVFLPNDWYLSDISSVHSNTSDLLIKSGYWWPDHFILIIFNTANNKYYLSEETRTYAFNSYFSFDMDKLENSPVELEKRIPLEKTYFYGKEVFEFSVRLLITLAIELLLAMAFKFTKKSLIIIGITNGITQVGLNASLNIFAYFNGKNPYILFVYVFVELAIIGVEAMVYKKLCKRGKDESTRWIISYAVLANIMSFGLGMLLWLIM